MKCEKNEMKRNSDLVNASTRQIFYEFVRRGLLTVEEAEICLKSHSLPGDFYERINKKEMEKARQSLKIIWGQQLN